MNEYLDLKPRTEQEVHAYEAGYAQAVDDAKQFGVQHAAETARLMCEHPIVVFIDGQRQRIERQ